MRENGWKDNGMKQHQGHGTLFSLAMDRERGVVFIMNYHEEISRHKYIFGIVHIYNKQLQSICSSFKWHFTQTD